MAREIMLSDGRTALFDDDATDADIEKKLKEKKLSRGTDPATTGMADSISPYLLSTANSLAFGLPEFAARQMGAGPYIEQMRQDYPVATTAGDITGLINPMRLGMKVAGKGMSALGEKIMQRGSSEMGQDAAMAAMRNQPATLPQQAGRYLLKPAGQIGGGMLAAQGGATALGAARTPENPMAGAQQGAQVFRETAMNLPGTQLIPGAQSTIGAVTSAIPAAMGYGDLAYQYSDINRRMREEAARRAMQGQQ